MRSERQARGDRDGTGAGGKVVRDLGGRSVGAARRWCGKRWFQVAFSFGPRGDRSCATGVSCKDAIEAAGLDCESVASRKYECLTFELTVEQALS